MIPRRPCPSEPPSAAPTAPRCRATSTSSSAARRSPASPSRASCAARARACWCSTATRSGSARRRRARRRPSGCATSGLEGPSARPSARCVVHTPRAEARWPLPWTFSTFDYRELCRLLWAQRGAGTVFETAKVEGAPARRPRRVRHRRPTDRGDGPWRAARPARRRRARLAPRARHGRERAAAGRAALARPGGASARARARTSSCGSTSGSSGRATAGRSRRGDELRVGVGSFDPRDHVKQPTVALAAELALPAERYQGNWIPHRIRPGDGGRRLLRRRLRRATACR